MNFTDNEHTTPAAEGAPPAVNLSKEEAHTKAREVCCPSRPFCVLLTPTPSQAGWTEKVAFDYDAFTRTGGADGNFLGEAKVYEWKDEYGDVAPAHEELEKILFGSEFKLREGKHREALEINVNVEGPERIKPVVKVRTCFCPLIITLRHITNTSCSSRMPVCTLSFLRTLRSAAT